MKNITQTRRFRLSKRLIGVLLAIVLAVLAGFWYFGYTPRPPLPRLSASVQRRSVTVGQLLRTYLVYAPAGLKPGAPVIFAFHGSGQDGAGLRQVTGYAFDRLADQHGFVVVYPDGYKRNWNDCRKKASYPARKLNVDDYGFTRAMISELHRAYAIDPRRVFATGHSNGGHLSFRFALEHPEDFAAVAPISASLPTPDNSVCQPVGRPIPVMIINGTRDPISPYSGGEVRLPVIMPSRGTVVSSEASARYFAALGGAESTPHTDRLPRLDVSDSTWVERKTWASPRGAAAVLLSVHGGGHVVPQPYSRYPRLLGYQTRNLDAPLQICRFFGVVLASR